MTDTMADKPQQPKGRDGILFALNVAIYGLNFAKELADVTPAKAAVRSVAILLTMIRVGPLPSAVRHSGFTGSQDAIANDQDYVDLGQACADICKALELGMSSKKLEELSRTVGDAKKQLTR